MPVYSPLPFRAVLSGFRALLSRSYAARARRRVEAWLKRNDARREVLLVDSGTSALRLAIEATVAATNRPIAIPAFGCFDIATAVDGAGVPFVFYDVDPRTLGPDLTSLRAALSAGADRVLIVHLYGVPVDLDAIGMLAQEFGATVIEDAAQAVGGTWRGVSLGFNGSLGIFSFGRGKGITGGGGGALVGNDLCGRTIVAECRGSAAIRRPRFREIVGLLAQWALARRSMYWIPSALPFLGLGETPYHPPHRVFVASSLAIGVVAENLTEADAESAKRASNSAEFIALAGSAGLSSVDVPRAGRAGYLRLPLLSPAGSAADGARERRLGIVPPYPSALPDLAGFGERALTLADPQGARLLARNLVTVPTHSALASEDKSALGVWIENVGRRASASKGE